MRCIGFILNYNSLVGKLGGWSSVQKSTPNAMTITDTLITNYYLRLAASDISSALNSIVKTLNETQAKVRNRRSLYATCAQQDAHGFHRAFIPFVFGAWLCNE